MTSSNGNIFPVTGPLCGRIQRPSVNSPHKDQWCEALMFSLIHAWTSGWVNNRDDDDLGRHRTHYDTTLILYVYIIKTKPSRFGCVSFWSINGYSVSLWIELIIFTPISHCHFPDTHTIIKLLLYSWIKSDKYRWIAFVFVCFCFVSYVFFQEITISVK